MVRFNPYAYEFHDDPFPVYQQLRDDAPCYHDEELGFWALWRHAAGPDFYGRSNGKRLNAGAHIPKLPCYRRI